MGYHEDGGWQWMQYEQPPPEVLEQIEKPAAKDRDGSVTIWASECYQKRWSHGCSWGAGCGCEGVKCSRGSEYAGRSWYWLKAVGGSGNTYERQDATQRVCQYRDCAKVVAGDCRYDSDCSEVGGYEWATAARWTATGSCGDSW